MKFKKIKSLKDIERSIIKRYRKDIWSEFIKTIKTHEMIKEGDKIGVAISGGKDSLLLAKLLQELQKHGGKTIELSFIAMDPGYNIEVREQLIENCKMLGIPLNIYDSDIFEITNNNSSKYPCFLCARMRRGFLYDKAKMMGCNKLALGHHFNDVIETTLINLFYGGSIKTMMPKLRADNFVDMELIRPMYSIKEKSIINWINYTGIEPLGCECSVSKKELGSKREEIKKIIADLKLNNNNIDKSIFKAMENIYLNKSLGWIKDDSRESYLDNY